MCKHFWIVDSKNVQRCKLCYKEVDCQPAIDRALDQIDSKVPIDYKMLRNLNIGGGYYMQSGFHRGGYAFGPGSGHLD